MSGGTKHGRGDGLPGGVDDKFHDKLTTRDVWIPQQQQQQQLGELINKYINKLPHKEKKRNQQTKPNHNKFQ